MFSYLKRRALTFIPTVIGVTFIIFFCLSLTPENDHPFPKEGGIIQRLIQWLPSALPVYSQWFFRAMTLDFGVSRRDMRPVSQKIFERLPATLELNVATLIITLLVGLPLGAFCAYWRGTLGESLLSALTFIFFSMPAFWIGLLMIILFGVIIPEWTSSIFGMRIGLPTSGRQNITLMGAGIEASFFVKATDYLRHLILPAITSALVSTATMARLSRAQLLDVLGADFIQTAKAKGLGTLGILKHALANALSPAITIISMMIPTIIGSSLIIENVFSWPGVGRLGYQAIMSRDYPVVMGIGLIVAFLSMLSGFFADFACSYLDPRVKLSNEGEL